MIETQLNHVNYQVAEVQLIYKTKVKASQRPKITTSKDAFDVLLSGWDIQKLELVEQFKVLLLNRDNKVLGIFELSSGGVSATVVDSKLIFAAALKGVATGIIIAHNHTSGNPKPSHMDIDLTKKIKEAGMFLDIRLFDHIILTTEGYFSFADEKLI